MGEAKRRAESGLNKVGSMRQPSLWASKSNQRCEKCKGETEEEGCEDFYQDGSESYDILRCSVCGFEKKFNIKWEGYQS
jgi:hypothetical protein